MLTNLEWLLPVPADYRARLKNLRAEIAAATDPAVIEEELHALALARLDFNQLGHLAAAAASHVTAAATHGPLARLRVGLLGSGTLDLLATAAIGGISHTAMTWYQSGYVAERRVVVATIATMLANIVAPLTNTGSDGRES